jgi:hypothetical protein
MYEDMDVEKLVADVILKANRMSAVPGGEGILLDTVKEYPDTWYLSFTNFLLEGKAETDIDYLLLDELCKFVEWPTVSLLLTDALERIVRPSDAVSEYDARNDAPLSE